jgi:hypothetical protein
VFLVVVVVVDVVVGGGGVAVRCTGQVTGECLSALSAMMFSGDYLKTLESLFVPAMRRDHVIIIARRVLMGGHLLSKLMELCFCVL